MLSIIFTYLCIKTATKFKIVDLPSQRKVHKKPIPYLGGVAIYFSFMITFILSILVISFFKFDIKISSLIITSLLLLLLGLYDDLKGVTPLLKLSFQIIIALILTLSGFIIDKITNPLGGSLYFPYWLSLILTVFWIVGIINAINLLDGLDGLAAGVINIASLFIFIIAIINSNSIIGCMTIILIGTTLGFLLFNFPPAKIFMGDTGSMFLGLIFAVIAIIGNRKSAVAINLVIPIVLLAIPIIDTLLAIIRRANKKKYIFKADKEHIHHRLLNLGIPYRKVIILIYLFCIYLGLISLASLGVPKEFTFILFLVIGINVFIGLYVLNLIEKYIRKK